MSNKKTYEAFAPAAKAYCLIVSIPIALGIAMYSSTYGKFYLVCAIFVLITQIVLSILPKSSFRNTAIIKSLATCGLLSCVFIGYQLFEDITLVNGPDGPAIFLRSILLLSILSITLTILNKEKL